MAFSQANVNYAAEYSAELANAMPYLSYFGAIFENENSMKYRPLRGATVEIPSLEVSGAVAASRNSINGSFSRNWNNAWQAVTLAQDREWSTLIDPLDMEETARVATVANITKTFNELQKVPEMDSFIAATLATKAIASSHADTTSLSAANILGQWDTYLAAMTDARFNRDRVVAYCTPATYKLLKEASGLTRFVDTGTGIRGVDRNVGKLDGVTIVEVPSDLMKTAYDYDEGFVAASGAGQVNLLMVAVDAVAAPVVYDTAMVSEPTADNKGKWIYYERFYYGCFVLNNRTAGVYINYTANPL